MNRLLDRMVLGSLGGLVGSGCMTFLRSAAQHAGVIERAVPQAVEESLAGEGVLPRPPDPVVHHVVDQLLHLGYGLAWGGAFGLVPRGRAGLGAGLLFGAGLWGMAALLVLPALDAVPPLTRRDPRSVAVDVAAHLVFGVATALVRLQLEAQPDHMPVRGRGPRAEASRTG